MGINLTPVTSLNLFGVKKNFETIGRQAWNLQKPTDSSYVASAPGTDDLEEGQAVLYDDGANFRIYVKINGSIRYATLT